MVNLSELYTLTKTTCMSFCIYAPTREAHSLAVFVLILLPVSGNLLLLVSQMRSWAISGEGHLAGGRGEPRAWVVLRRLLCFSPLKARKGKDFDSFDITTPWKSLLKQVSCTVVIRCVYLWRCIHVPQLYCLQISVLFLFLHQWLKMLFHVFMLFLFKED